MFSTNQPMTHYARLLPHHFIGINVGFRFQNTPFSSSSCVPRTGPSASQPESVLRRC